MKTYRIKAKASNGDWIYLDRDGDLRFNASDAEAFSTQTAAMKCAVWAMLEWPRVDDWEMETVE